MSKIIVDRGRNIMVKIRDVSDSTNKGIDRDIFNLSDLSDLPSPLRAQLSVDHKELSSRHRIVQLLKLSGQPLNINQVMVGMYRKFNTILTRKQTNQLLYLLVKEGTIQQMGTTRPVRYDVFRTVGSTK